MSSQAPVVQANYDQLTQIAQKFVQTSESTAEMLQSVRAKAEQLRGGGWAGEAALRFQEEMEGEIVPAVRRLETALSQAGRITQQIVSVLQTAEAEAEALFKERGHVPFPTGGAGGGGNGGSGGGGGVLGFLHDIVKGVKKVIGPINAAVKFAKWFPKQAARLLDTAASWVKKLPGPLSRKILSLAGRVAPFLKKVPVIGTVLSVASGLHAAGQTWVARWDEYVSMGPVRGTAAFLLDGVGAVAADVGGIAFGPLDWVSKKFGAEEGWGTIAQNWLTSSETRNDIINAVDTHVVRPVSDAVSSAWNTVTNIKLPSIGLPDLSFGF